MPTLGLDEEEDFKLIAKKIGKDLNTQQLDRYPAPVDKQQKAKRFAKPNN